MTTSPRTFLRRRLLRSLLYAVVTGDRWPLRHDWHLLTRMAAAERLIRTR